MALKNYILKGSYARIEHLMYSKHGKRISLDLHVYEDETMSRAITVQNIQIAGEYPWTEVEKVVTKVKDFQEIASLAKEGILLQLSSPSEQMQKVNGHAAVMTAGQMSFVIPSIVFVKSTGKWLSRKLDGTYVESPVIKTAKQWDDCFSEGSDIHNKVYAYLKTLPEFSSCVDA